jgi:hypothetical protein
MKEVGKYFKLEELNLPFDELTLNDDELLVLKGGATAGVDSGGGCDCGCGCTKSSGNGCNCSNGSGNGCGCKCDCKPTPAS